MKERQLTPEELRKVQLLELKVLKEIKRVCKKHDIKYFLTGGTLIGAARHKGFVPWDDDIDIAMMRTEYDRFLEIAPRELGPEYTLNCIQHDKKLGIFLSKVVLKGTNYRSVQQPATIGDCGFWVDVIPYDHVYDNQFLATLYFRFLNFLLVLYAKKNGYRNGLTPLRRFVANMMKICFFWVPKEWLWKRLVNYPYKLNKKNTGKRCYLAGRYGAPHEFRDAYLFGEYTEIPFEDDNFMVLKRYKQFLSDHFGDYMTLPPVEQRVTHQVAELDFGKY